VHESPAIDALRSLGLETLSDREVFSRIALLASTMLECPIALLIIAEAERLWFLGRTGTDRDAIAISQPADAAFLCDEAPVLINDAADDPRIRDHPLVAGDPFIRSYLGVPIRSEGGQLLGTLCALSPQPDAFRPEQIAPLTMLAELAEQGIALRVRTQSQRLANAALQQSSQIFRQAERAVNVGSWRVDIATNRLHWSDQVYTITGLEPGHSVNVAEAVKLYHPDDRSMISTALRDTIDHGKPFQFETSIRRSDGERRRIRVIGERVDVDGRPDSVAGIILDCTEEHQRNVALKRAAERDRLTGLYNRASFDRRLAAAMALATDQEQVTVALIDLDGFKDVNDTLGHLIGDQVLEAIAAQLAMKCAPGVFLARWGGDEFAMLFPAAMSLGNVTAFLEDLLLEFSQIAPLGNAMLKLGATCGVAQMALVASGEEIMRRADLALYRGKEDGRGKVVCWDHAIEARQSERQQAIVLLHSALNEGRTIAAYQPIVALQNGEPVCLEALLRLREEDGTLRAASDFFTALLDPELSRWVSRVMLDQVVADGPMILDRFGTDCRIALNLSEADLRQGDFVHQLIAAISASPVLRPANITIEVTETMLLDPSGQLRASLELLDAHGFTICLDDFGSGFSSLTHLRQFPIHKVKIDREFIAAINADHQSRLIIQAIVQMGHSLGLRVVVEGVETEEQETFLRGINCRYVQGYRYGQPMLVADLCAEFGKRAAGAQQQRRSA
jgi:diguanylate cyclase (GGDEF)-like protein/PAS domain S-box-containing protein